MCDWTTSAITAFTVDFDGARYMINVELDSVFVQRAALDFYLPPSFLEITSNAELPSNRLTMSISARLKVCFEELFCTSTGSERFRFDAELIANYVGTELLDINVAGDEGLNFTFAASSYDHRYRQRRRAGSMPFYRTVTVDFSDFTGHLDLGENSGRNAADDRIHHDGTRRRTADRQHRPCRHQRSLRTREHRSRASRSSAELVFAPVPEPSLFALWLSGGCC